MKCWKASIRVEVNLVKFSLAEIKKMTIWDRLDKQRERERERDQQDFLN